MDRRECERAVGLVVELGDFGGLGGFGEGAGGAALTARYIHPRYHLSKLL